MRKQIKIVAVAATSILILVGTTFYVIEKSRVITDPITIVETDGTIYEIDMISDAKSISDGIDYYMETVETPISIETEIPTNPINTEVIRVIEEDEDTGSITIENTEGDVVVTNDEALAIAEANSEAEDILKSIMADYVAEDNNTVEKADKAEIKVVKPEVKKSDEELKKVFSSETTSTKKNDDVEIDQATKDLFAEMGWRTDAAEHQTDIEGGVWTFQEYEGEGNPFNTP